MPECLLPPGEGARRADEGAAPASGDLASSVGTTSRMDRRVRPSENRGTKKTFETDPIGEFASIFKEFIF
jgi:bacillopeptidase F (M6 metalloprotease family)